MATTLERVVPWGRSFDEYAAMFALIPAELRGRILGCGDGPASFHAEARARGADVVSCDPLYALDAGEIEARVEAARPEMIERMHENRAGFRWDALGSPERVGDLRMTALRRFLADYPRGREEGRYVDAGLPALPFRDGEFDLVLCSHLLFLYSEPLGRDFHLDAVRELCRVATEVRIFPLRTLAGEPSPHLAPVLETLRGDGLTTELVRVPYEFQRGSDTMLRVRRRSAERERNLPAMARHTPDRSLR